MFDRIGMSVVSIEETKYVVTMSVLDALKAMYELEIQDYNYKELIVVKESYTQALIDLQAKYIDNQDQLQALQASYASLACKFKKVKKNIQS